MTILRKFVTPFFSLKRVHADIFLLACILFNEQEKASSLLSSITLSVLGKQNVQVNKVYGRNDQSTCNLLSDQNIFLQESILQNIFQEILTIKKIL